MIGVLVSGGGDDVEIRRKFAKIEGLRLPRACDIVTRQKPRPDSIIVKSFFIR